MMQSETAIKSLGKWHQFQFSLFYVNTIHNPNDAFTIVGSKMDRNDKLAVIEATGGIVTTWDNPPIDAINAVWNVRQLT